MAYIGNVTYLEDVTTAVYPLWIKFFFSIDPIYCSRIDRGLILIIPKSAIIILIMKAKEMHYFSNLFDKVDYFVK